MFYKFALFVLILNSINAEDYCTHEYFTPECKHDEVVIMEKAIYGRMDTGKCLKIPNDSPMRKDGMYFGCESNVLEFMDRQCSGHQSCKVLVAHPELMKRSSCHQDLMHFMSASYSCQQVISVHATCNVWITSTTNLLIDTKSINNNIVSSCGKPGSLLVIEAPEGQQINISLLMFKIESVNIDKDNELKVNGGNKRIDGQNKIVSIGKITDSSSKSDHDLLCNFGLRQLHQYLSKGNKLGIEIYKNVDARYLLTFEATGCYDLKPPQDAWMKREGNEITVGCYMNRHTWKLVCNGRNWIGVIGNCTQQSQDLVMELSGDLSKPKVAGISNENKTAFILIVGISLIILISLVMICSLMIYCQRSKLSRKYQGNSMYDGNINQPFNTIINGDLKTLHEKEANGKLENYQDPGYYVLENDDGNKDKNLQCMNL